MQSIKSTLISVGIMMLILCVQACENATEETVPEIGTSYFPLRTGIERVYLVDSLSYDNNTGTTIIDTFQYFYREQVGEKILDDEGEKGYFILRSFSDTPEGRWNQTFRWTAYQNQLMAKMVEDNQIFVKQVYPLTSTKNWDGNMYNNLGTQRYRITEYESPYGGYTKTILVQHQNDSNFIELIRKEERYAKDIGLVYFKFDSINTQVSGSRGFRKRYTLIKFQ